MNVHVPKVRVSRAAALIILALLMLLGLALRLDFLVANDFVIDSDEAIVGLMGIDVLHGKSWPVFYYGQHYMGSLEALLAALAFALFGKSSQALIAVPLTFAVLLIPLTYLLARQVTGRLGGLVAAGLMAAPPSGLLVWSSKPRGGFIEVVFLGALAMLLAARWLRRTYPRWWETGLIGFLLGLGWWVNNQIIYFMVPIGFFLFCSVIKRDELLRERLVLVAQHLAAGLGAFVVGGLPFWWYNLQHSFVSFKMLTHASRDKLLDQAGGLFSTALPILLGAKRFWQSDDVFFASTWCAYLLYGLLAFGYCWHRRRRLGELALCRVEGERPVELFSLFVLTSCVVFVTSSFGWLYAAPRYLLPVYVGLFVLVGFMIEHWYAHARLRFLAVLFGAGFFSLNVASSYLGGRAIPGEPLVYQGERVSKDHRELITWLRKNDLHWVRTNYWIGYRLAFETSNEVRFLTYQDPQYERIPEYREDSRGIDPSSMPLLLVPAQAQQVERALSSMGYTFEKVALSGYEVFWKIQPSQRDLSALSPLEFSLSATTQRGHPELAVDSNLESRWGTGEPQSPGQAFEIDLKEPQVLRAVAFDLGGFPQDFPRGLSIELLDSSGRWVPVLDPSAWEAVRFYVERSTRFDFLFPAVPARAVRLRQLGRDPIFDWSIAELWLYR